MTQINIEKLNQMISKLPPETQPIAKKYADRAVSVGIDEIYGIVSNLVDGNTDVAYQMALVAMSDDELSAEIKRLNSQLDAEVNNSAQETEDFKTLVKILITIALSKYGVVIP